MKIYARIDNGTVQEIINLPDEVEVTGCFVSEIVETLVDVSSLSPIPEPGNTAVETDGHWSFGKPESSAPIVDLSRDAQIALDKSDITLLRCIESGVAFPQTWKGYRDALRPIAKGESQVIELPPRPDYPAGT